VGGVGGIGGPYGNIGAVRCVRDRLKNAVCVSILQRQRITRRARRISQRIRCTARLPEAPPRPSLSSRGGQSASPPHSGLTPPQGPDARSKSRPFLCAILPPHRSNIIHGSTSLPFLSTILANTGQRGPGDDVYARAAGMISSTSVPAFGWLHTVNFPPRCSDRSRIPRKP
jgi:hypothetical protein